MVSTNFSPPANACDCHLHVVGPKAQYPMASQRAYTPMDAPLNKLLGMHERLGIERMVLIQTSVFGFDNSCMLDALAKLGSRARGVAVLPEDTTREALDSMHQLGVRGIRVNIATYGSSSVDKIAEQLSIAARLCAHNGWHVQLFTPADVIPALEPIIDSLPVPIVIDHFGLIPPQDEIHPAETVLHRLLEKGNTWIKVSGAYRLGDDRDNEFSDPRIGSLARRFFQTNPARIVWGTDWPHSPPHGNIAEGEEEAPYRDFDTLDLLRELNLWFNDRQTIQKILVENPAVLYEF